MQFNFATHINEDRMGELLNIITFSLFEKIGSDNSEFRTTKIG